MVQLNQVFASGALAFSVFETTVSRVHAWENALLHGIAAAFDVTNFRLAFYINVYVLFITRINRKNSPQLSGMFEFWFLDCPKLFFSSLSGFSNSCPSVRPYVIWT